MNVIPNTTENAITCFRGDFFFLSNFYRHGFEWMHVYWPTSEHAYQALKTVNPKVREYVRNLESPGAAKAFGRKIRPLRPHWDELKTAFMYLIVEAKFLSSQELMDRLLATGDKVLVEGNDWGDWTWGATIHIPWTGAPAWPGGLYGKNELGKILMDLRSQFAGDDDGE